MAYSSSIKRAQAIKLCELCNEDNIKWRCIDCDRCLCHKCKTIHLNVPVTAKHQIVTIATPIKEVKRKVVTDNIPCMDHGTRMTCMFCDTCDCLVCPKCVSTAHSKHQFTPIEEALIGKMEELETTQARVIGKLKICDSKSTEIQHMMSKYNSIFDESVTKIKQKEQELKDAISKYSKVLQDRVEGQRSKIKTTITKVKQQIDRARKKFENMKQELETALLSNQGQVIFNTTPAEPTLELDNLPHKVENFVPKTEAPGQIQELFGSFQEKTIPRVQPEIGFEVLKTFTTDLPYIHYVLPLDETTVWISCNSVEKSIQKMKKVTIQDNNLKTLDEKSLAINDMALTSANDVLLTKWNTSDVILMSKSGEIKRFLTVAPLCPYGIDVTSDNKVIVGVIERGNTYTPTDKSMRAVIVFGMDGKQEQIFQYDSNRKRLFTFPGKIRTNKNYDVIVVDETSETTGRVVTLDGEGKLKWIYEGHPEINKAATFFPMSLDTTVEGYIILNDYNRHALHVLSEDGDPLLCKVMVDMGITFPYGLKIDSGGKLWVGCAYNKDKKAKLHIVKLMIQ